MTTRTRNYIAVPPVFFLVLLAMSRVVFAQESNSNTESQMRFDVNGVRYPRVVIATYLKNMLTPLSPNGDVPDRIRVPWQWSEKDHDNIRQEMRLARSAGIDGFAIDIFPGHWRSQLAGYRKMVAAAKAEGFSLVPLIDTHPAVSHTLADIVTVFRAIAEDSQVVIKVDGRPLVVGYANETWSPEQWVSVFAEVNEWGFKPFFLATHSASPAVSWWHDYLVGGGFDGMLSFWSYATSHREEIRQMDQIRRETGRPNALVGASTNNGYWRPSDELVIDSRGTQMFRKRWNNLLMNEVDVAHITSWNDLTEYHHIIPSEFLGRTRLDITRYFAQRFHNQPISLDSEPQIYITYRRSLLAGEALSIEVLNLPSKAPQYFLHCEVRNPSGRLLSAFKPRLVQTLTEQAERFDFSTTSACNDRCVGIYVYCTTDAVPLQNVNESLRIGIVLVQPVLNRNLTEMSVKVSDIPKIYTFKVKGELGARSGLPVLESLQAKIKSDSYLTRMQVRRNGPPVLIADSYRNKTFLDVYRPPGTTKDDLIRVRLAMARQSFTVDKDTDVPWEALVEIEHGTLVHVYDDSPTQNRKPVVQIRSKSAHSVNLTTYARSHLAPQAVVLLIDGGPRTQIKMSVDGQTDRWTVDQLSADDVPLEIETTDDATHGRVMAMLMDGMSEPEAYDASPFRIKRLRYQQDFQHVRRQSPNDFYFIRAMGELGWKDSFVILSRNPANAPVTREFLDQQSQKVFSVKLWSEELLVASYGFDEPDGSQIIDNSDYHFHARLGGGSLALKGESLTAWPQRVPGIEDQALLFDGVDDYVLLPAGITPLGVCSLEMWIKPAKFGKRQALFSDSRFNSSGGSLALHLEIDGKLTVSHKRKQKPSWENVSSSVPLSVEHWHHVVTTYDFDSLCLYIDGELVASRFIGPGVGTLGVATIGTEVDQGMSDFVNYFCGTIDQVRLLARPLKPPEIRRQFESRQIEQ